MNRWTSGYSKATESAKSLPLSENPGIERDHLVRIKCFIEQITEHLHGYHFCTFRFHEIEPSLCTFLLFRTIISIKRYGMKWSISCKFVVLLHHNTEHLASIFFKQLFRPFPTETSKYANLRIIVFSIWRHIRPSTHSLLNSVVNQNGGILTYFDEP